MSVHKIIPLLLLIASFQIIQSCKSTLRKDACSECVEEFLASSKSLSVVTKEKVARYNTCVRASMNNKCDEGYELLQDYINNVLKIGESNNVQFVQPRDPNSETKFIVELYINTNRKAMLEGGEIVPNYRNYRFNLDESNSIIDVTFLR